MINVTENLANVLIFCPHLCSIKNREEVQNGRESNDGIKKELFISLTDGQT